MKSFLALVIVLSFFSAHLGATEPEVRRIPAFEAKRSNSLVAGTRPNIVFILADDLGWSDTTLYGTTKFYQTPNLERLARRGMLFTRAYAASPLCSPTRASILTGQSPARIGITAPNCHLPEERLEASVRQSAPAHSKVFQCESATRFDTNHFSLAKALKQAGYVTGHFGKWHLGPEPYSPLEHGFDVDVPNWPGPGPAGSFVAPWKFKNFAHRTPGEHIEDRMGDEAVAFMTEHKDKPFFLNYWQFSVHAPFNAKKELVEKYRPLVDSADPQRSPTYAAMVQSLDENVGKILDAIDRLGIAERTAIIFFSDNGGNMYDQVDNTTPTSNAPLRGGKATMFEGGVRVPCIVSWPAITTPGSRSDTVVQSTDFYPTFLELLRLKPQPGQIFDGISIAPVLRGESLTREAIFTYFPHTPARVPDKLPPAASVHHGDWKLIRLFHEGANGEHDYQLYNLKNDVGETHNLAAQQPERVQQLDVLIEKFLTETKAVVPKPNPSYDPSAVAPAPVAKTAPVNRPAAARSRATQTSDLLTHDNGTIRVGIDPTKGGSITWLSWNDYPKNAVNISDPGRLIQQSYYAGNRLDRTAEGQSARWSPWTWNPIQGGGVSSWARVTDFKRIDKKTLYSETIPKLWDMPNEEAAARMRQWTGFEPGMPDVLAVRCEFISQRAEDDRWGPAVPRAQEIPACYFTRNFDRVKSYLGNGEWRDESQPPGPPWGKAEPPRKAMAVFTPEGHGIAVFSPSATQRWNFGPHGSGLSDDPTDRTCMHLSPIDRVNLGPKSEYRYRYWITVGTEAQLSAHLDALWKKYSEERAELTEPSAAPSARDAASKPNILLIFTDDHGWTDFSPHGVDKDVRTPNLHRFARDGILFHRGYVTAPQCVPSRAGLIAGQHQNRFGVEENSKGPLPLEVVTVPERLKRAGYITGMVGKWHLDHSTEGAGKEKTAHARANFLPHNHGFDEYWSGNVRQYHASHDLEGRPLANAPAVVRDDRFRITVQTEAALAFLDRRAAKPEQPWFLYLPWFAPHVPLESPEPWFSKTPAHLPTERRQALAMIEAMDHGVGLLRKKLRDMGQENNTLIFFISDNGAPLKEGAWNGSLNLPLIGEKGMLTDGGVRVPFAAVWPGTLPRGSVFDHPVSTLDVGATAVALAGLPHDDGLDGVNLIPFLTGKIKGAPHDALFWRWRSQAAVLEFPWKLIHLGESERYLFNVTNPDGERINLIAGNPAIAARLDEKFKAWSATLKPPGPPEKRHEQDNKFFSEHVKSRFANDPQLLRGRSEKNPRDADKRRK